MGLSLGGCYLHFLISDQSLQYALNYANHISEGMM